jgi:hypothetical protein
MSDERKTPPEYYPPKVVPNISIEQLEKQIAEENEGRE